MKKNELMESLRLPFERDFYGFLFKSVVDGELLFEIYQNRVSQFKSKGIESDFLLNMFKITKKTAPKIQKIIEEVLEKVNISRDEVDFFITSSQELNAFAYSINKELAGEKPAVVLFAGIVKILSEEELKFVIAHELAHIYYAHSKLNFIYKELVFTENKFQTYKFKEIPLLNYFQHWQHLSEISADRVGLYAVDDEKDAIKALVKLSHGLSDDVLIIDLNEYLKEIDKMIRESRGFLFSEGDHPLLPIRIKIIEEEAKSEFFKKMGERSIKDDTVDRLKKYLLMITKQPDKDLINFELSFLNYAGLLMLKADGRVDKEELIYLTGAKGIHSLFSGINENDMNLKPEDLKERTFKLIDILNSKFPERRLDLFEFLVSLAIYDGKFTREEYELLKELGGKMKFSEQEINIIILNNLKNSFAPSLI